MVRGKKDRLFQKREAAGATQPGDLIPLYDFQREFLTLRGKIIVNHEMEMIMLSPPESKERMRFGGHIPLPVERPMTPKDWVDLNAAKTKNVVCKDPCCKLVDKEQPAKYVYVIRHKQVPHSEDANQDKMYEKKFGRKEISEIWSEIRCRGCGKYICQVKYNNANRRAAEDPSISGPHQWKTKTQEAVIGGANPGAA